LGTLRNLALGKLTIAHLNGQRGMCGSQNRFRSQAAHISYFLYKYVVMHQDKALKWEQGPKRIADLEILPDRNRIGHNNSSM